MAVSYRQLTSELKEQIILAFNQGMKCKEIQIQLDLSQRSVRRVLAEAGVSSKRRNRYTLDEGYFEQVNSPEKAYALGLMGADGCVMQSNYVVFESTDQSLTEFLKTQFQYSGKIRIIHPKGDYKPHYRINFSSRRLAASLKQQGVVSDRTSTGVYYLPSGPLFSAYLLGYFDGDGCAYQNKGRSGGKICIVGSQEFVRGLIEFTGKGIASSHIRGKVHYWDLYHGQDIQWFYDFVYQYSNLGLMRKQQKVEAILGSYRRG